MLPHTPLQHTPIAAQGPHGPHPPGLLSKQPTTSNSINSYISSLSDYLDSLLAHRDDTTPLGKCPWIGCSYKGDDWTVKREFTMTAVQLSLALLKRGEAGGLSWDDCVKVYKKSLSYALSLSCDDAVVELSESIFQVYRSVIELELQLGVIHQKLMAVKEQEYDISTINTTLFSKVVIHVRDLLLSSIQQLKSCASFKLRGDWLSHLQMLLRYVNGLIGVLLSVDSYNKGDLGESLGWLNFGSEYIQSGDALDQTNNKMKLKVISIKKKITLKKRKLNMELYKGLPNYQPYISILFELSQVLEVKYVKQNDNLSFDEVVSRSELEWPLGRGIPMDVKPWNPTGVIKEVGGYY